MSKQHDPSVEQRIFDLMWSEFGSISDNGPTDADLSRVAVALAKAGFTDIAPNGGPVKQVCVLPGIDIQNAIAYRHERLQKDVGDAARNLSSTGLLPPLVDELREMATVSKLILKSRTYALYEVKKP